MDLDVEEPNCYIFNGNATESSEPCFRPIPSVDMDRCTLCGTCGEVCQFHAIVVLPKEVMVFSELCHACGACSIFCPETAITEKGHPAGEVVVSSEGRMELLYGRLRVGEAMPSHLIRQVRNRIPDGLDAVLDCPPGTSCASVESIRGADLCLLVTEPTPFGLHDLKLALGMTRKLKIATAVFVNKHGLPGPDIDAFCNRRRVPVIGRLPMDIDIARSYSRGDLLVDREEYREVFDALRDAVMEMCDL